MISRRNFVATSAVVGTGTWVAPSVVGLDRVAAASSSSLCEKPALADGAVWLDPAPASTAEGGPMDSNTNTYVWAEQGPVQLTAALAVNRVTAGAFNGSSNESESIAAGTWICSYYIHGDRLDDRGTLTGSLSFASSTIIGLIYRTTQLNASHYLGAPGTTIVTGPMESNDNMKFDGSTSLYWEMRFGGHLDQIRVITACP